MGETIGKVKWLLQVGLLLSIAIELEQTPCCIFSRRHLFLSSYQMSACVKWRVNRWPMRLWNSMGICLRVTLACMTSESGRETRWRAQVLANGWSSSLGRTAKVPLRVAPSQKPSLVKGERMIVTLPRFADRTVIRRTAADVSFVRARVFYARPNRNPESRCIIVGLPYTRKSTIYISLALLTSRRCPSPAKSFLFSKEEHTTWRISWSWSTSASPESPTPEQIYFSIAIRSIQCV